jgi:glutamate dehydrogenase (NADP+)
MYKKLRNEWTGVLTGKGLGWGGSLIRPEATGYGNVFFAENMLETVGQTFKGKRCLVSGSGNVAQYTIEKLLQLGATPVTASDSSGYIYDEKGIDTKKLEFIMDLKNNRRGRIAEYADAFASGVFVPVDAKLDYNPLWNHKADCAFPSATQNEINGKDAQNLINNGIQLVSEGANMPSDLEAVNIFLSNNILYAPGKASNAGGVATSGLEMSQNSLRLYWTSEEVEARLKAIMRNIHAEALATSKKYGHERNYVVGANIAGFEKVANAMIAQGVV